MVHNRARNRLWPPQALSIFSPMILITGGTGFIGSNLVGRVVDHGARVSISDTLGTGDKWRNIARHEIDELVNPADLDDLLARRGDEVEFVYHMGAISATTETDADLIAATNFRLSQKIWRWCTAHSVPLVYASSAATYGDGSQGFADGDDIEELARLRPLNAYGWSKHLFDRWVAREIVEGRGHPPSWVGLKFFNVYGPNEYHKADMRSVVTKAYPSAAAGEAVTLFRSHHPDYEDGGQMRDFVMPRPPPRSPPAHGLPAANANDEVAREKGCDATGIASDCRSHERGPLRLPRERLSHGGIWPSPVDNTYRDGFRGCAERS